MTTPRLEPGDCVDVMIEMAAAGLLFDSVVTDPPYHLTSVVDRFGNAAAAPAQHGTDGLYARQSRGFMGKAWDGGDIAFRPETWRLAYDLLKPGGHLVAFGGTRTAHRMTCAIEDAGFEIRDSLLWLYGTGFPKSHDVAKGIDRHLGARRPKVAPRSVIGHQRNVGNHRPYMDDPAHTTDSDVPASAEAAAWQGWGTALKPAYEPIVLARKPFVGSVAKNVLRYGTGALNVDGCRINKPPGDREDYGVSGDEPSRAGNGITTGDRARVAYQPANGGRWPANVVHDGSDDVLAAFAAYGESRSPAVSRERGGRPDGTGYGMRGVGLMPAHGDAGTAARFFYSAKAGAADRAGSKHPTVKPIALMRYLCRLVTPPGGKILDPFAGSGTTLAAAHAEGFAAVGIERDPEYQADILRRLDAIEMESMLA